MIEKYDKICNLYVNDWHNLMAIIPFMDQEMKSERKIFFITQNNFKQSFKTLLSKLNLASKLKLNINKIEWVTEKNYINLIGESNKLLFIIKGTAQYISDLNIYFDKFMQRENLDIIVLNCYNIFENNNHIENLIMQHTQLLNTTGLNEVKSMFYETL